MYDRIASHDGVRLIIPQCGIAGSNPAPATEPIYSPGKCTVGFIVSGELSQVYLRQKTEVKIHSGRSEILDVAFSSRIQEPFEVISAARSVSGSKPGKSAGNGTDKAP